MVAGLLYVIGLISVLVSIAVAGFYIPSTISDVMRQIDTGGSGLQNLLTIAQSVGAAYGGFLIPFIGGLLLMAMARIMMLLGAINRSLRGQN